MAASQIGAQPFPPRYFDACLVWARPFMPLVMLHASRPFMLLVMLLESRATLHCLLTPLFSCSTPIISFPFGTCRSPPC